MEFIDGTALLKRQLIRDTVPDHMISEVMTMMDVVPGSPEVEDLEQKQSQRRLNTLLPINEVLMTVASLVGEILGRAILDTQGIDPSEAELAQYSRMVYAGSMAVIANLSDMGFISIDGGGFRGFLG